MSSYGKSLKLFGVEILVEREREDAMNMNKSFSTGNLYENHGGFRHYCSGDGYLSDGLLHRARKKGKTWTREEHQLFLLGMEKLGRGDWKGIAEKYMKTRTAVQVASHAQKYFLRVAASIHKKKRPSVFDAPLPQSAPIVEQGPSLQDWSRSRSRSVKKIKSDFPKKGVRGKRQERRHPVASCYNLTVSHSSSSAQVNADFKNQGYLSLAQAQKTTPTVNLQLGTALQTDQIATSATAFDNLELKLWHAHANDDTSNLSKPVFDVIKVV